MTRLIALIPIALLLGSCSKPAAVTSSLTPAEAQALTDSFARLELVLASKASAIHTNLAPPASEADIAALRTALNGTTNAALEAWFRWHNGARNRNTSLLPLGWSMSIAESLEERKMIQSVPFVDKLRKSAVKILDDGAGDGFFVDVTKAPPVVFYHMLEDPTPLAYGTMTEFVNFIATGFENEVFFINAAGEFAYAAQKYETLEAAHFRAVGGR
jgi:hypothetical protein